MKKIIKQSRDIQASGPELFKPGKKFTRNEIMAIGLIEMPDNAFLEDIIELKKNEVMFYFCGYTYIFKTTKYKDVFEFVEGR